MPDNGRKITVFIFRGQLSQRNFTLTWVNSTQVDQPNIVSIFIFYIVWVQYYIV